ncbi:unnamed protein product [Strongylus vulgaris]|uniref:Uncharacterized protein n=1 Tax=Strongylus vulgaris TaxID=40348 RepID=A0A3P7LDA1_STRVU|nr:unnamed protein product [Strongylus vulgaris]
MILYYRLIVGVTLGFELRSTAEVHAPSESPKLRRFGVSSFTDAQEGPAKSAIFWLNRSLGGSLFHIGQRTCGKSFVHPSKAAKFGEVLLSVQRKRKESPAYWITGPLRLRMSKKLRPVPGFTERHGFWTKGHSEKNSP